MLLKGILYGVTLLVCLTVFANVRSRRVRQALLLVASYGVYVTWGWWFALVLLTSTVMNFLLGKSLRRNPRVPVLFIGIGLNLVLLSSFKYLPQVASSGAVPALSTFSHLLLPVGISFWTFQAMSYLIDLYREEELDPSFVEFALYMAFFPVAVSGPVCRLPDMLPQFRSEEPLRWPDVGEGFRRIAIGVLMMQLAHLLGQGILGGDGINSGFDRVQNWSGADVWCLAFGYGLQLFFDFAGYSHIAIGAAKALGFTVPENFARPFQSTSPSIFWTRWHMSLSFWIRDYVFFPLATERRDLWWKNLALLLSMVAFGVWHKATVLFVLWGAYHGLLLVLHRQVQRLERNVAWTEKLLASAPLSSIATISLVSLGWIFFRANSLAQAGRMWSAVVSPETYMSHQLTTSLYVLVAALAAAYAMISVIDQAFDRVLAPSGSQFDDQQPRAIPALVRWRWYWVTPLYVVALLVVSIVTATHAVGAAQLMYGVY